jgi:hypothetical protein
VNHQIRGTVVFTGLNCGGKEISIPSYLGVVV